MKLLLAFLFLVLFIVVKAKERIIVSTDIGGADPDDFQSMVHLLVYSDSVDIEGLVSTCNYAKCDPNGNVTAIFETLDAYANDFPFLSSHSVYPSPASLRGVTKQGSRSSTPAIGYSSATEGSDWIIRQAKKDDPRPLYILVWGTAADIAQALHDDPTIKSKVRIYFIASWNREQDPRSFDYIKREHSDAWIIQCETTFRGMYVGGNQSGDLSNTAFVNQHVRYHGALGNLFYSKKVDIKMGDTPSLLYVLNINGANPSDPTAMDNWGGSYIKNETIGTNWYVDNPNVVYRQGTFNGAKTVNVWRGDYLRDWQQRMERTISSSTFIPPPVAHWKLDENTGTSVSSSSNSLYSTPGSISGASWITGLNVKTILHYRLRFTGAFTISAWVKVTSFTSNGRIINKQGGSSARGWSLNVENTGVASFQIATSSSTLLFVNSVSSLSVNTWVHLAGTYTPGSNLSIYVNGILDNSLTSGIPNSQYNSNLNVRIGARPIASPNTPFSGVVDEVKIFNVALSQSQVALIQ